MQSHSRKLFVVPFSNTDARTFVHSLAEGLNDSNIAVMDSGLTTLLFETKKFDTVHFFLPAEKSSHRLMRKRRPTAAIFQTLLNAPHQPADYKNAIFTGTVVTFSEKESLNIRQVVPDVKTEVILPCIAKPALTQLEPSSVIREKYSVQDRVFAVALNDFNDQQHFASFLYTAREYQRRGGFRFVIPLYQKDRKSLVWRQRLRNAITQENLTATTLLDAEVDLHSLIDAADIALHMDKRPSPKFGFPLVAVEALCAGKPVIAYNVSPISEVVEKFRREWVANVYEDFSRISKDILKKVNELEQISTELARYARSRMAVESVAERYKELYKPVAKL